MKKALCFLILFIISLSLALSSPAYAGAPIAGFGNAVDFSPDKILDIPNNVRTSVYGSLDYTISMWVYPKENVSGFQTLYRQVSSGNSLNKKTGLWLYISEQKLALGFHDGLNWQSESSNTSIPIKQWSQIQLVKSGVYATVYINGVQDISMLLDWKQTIALTSTGAITVGGDHEEGNNFKGVIDEIQLWTTPLQQNVIINWKYREIDFTHPNYSKLAFYYKLNESIGSTASDTLSFSNGNVVNMINSNWVTSDIHEWTILEETSFAGKLIGSDTDGSSSDGANYILNFNKVLNPAHGVVTINSNSFTYTPNPDYVGRDSFTYKVNDGGTDSNPSIVVLNINQVNDAPTFTKGANQIAYKNSGSHVVSGWAKNISAGPQNESWQVVDFNISNDNNSLFAIQPAVAADGTLTYTLADNVTGTATVSLQAYDNGGTANGGVDTSQIQTFTITVIVDGVIVDGAKWNKFTADGITYYPFEIYLPNEQNPNAYRIHTSYTKNTDACASCHRTHTAVGTSLLQWYSVYETCMACHDGTVTTTYNVEEGIIGATGKATMGGAFGNGSSLYQSSHNVIGSVNISAAPGGSILAETITVGDENKARWTTGFGCESCHTPHGMGGNARILHPDANYYASDLAETKGWKTTGITANVYDTIKDGDIMDTKYGVLGKCYFAYQPIAGSGNSVSDSAYDTGNGFYFLKSYPYTITVNGTETGNPGSNSTWWTDNSKGYTRIIYNGNDNTVINGTYKLTIAGVPTVKVTMNIKNYLGYVNSTETFPSVDEVVYHVSGMNVFCGTCHTDYNTMIGENFSDNKFTGSASSETGIYSKAHRHQVGTLPTYNTEENLTAQTLVFENGKMECLTCHVAHGVNKDYWQTSLIDAGVRSGADNSLWQESEIIEIAGSSALKRIPNMGTCEACHQKGEGSEGYGANSGLTLGNTPGTDNGIYGTTGAEYVGMKVGNCQECHLTQYNEWSASSHRLVIQAGNTGILSQARDNWVTGPGTVAKIGGGGSYTVDDVVYTLGYKKYQNYIVQDGANLRILPYRWGVATSATPGWAQENLTADAWKTISYKDECIGCHTTSYNFTEGTATDLGVTCEACHGPAGNHIKFPWSDKNIVTPKTLATAYQSDLCGQCHAKGQDLTDNTPYPTGYLPGTLLTATFNVFDRTEAPTSYWPDGSAKGRYMEYNDYINEVTPGMDNKHENNGLSCYTCHSAHGSNTQGRMLKTPDYTICANCHDIGVSSMKDFVDSYMPYTSQAVSGSIYDLRSHRFSRDFTYPIIINN